MNEAKKQDLLQPIYPQYIQTNYIEDEINLVDLWIALAEYKKIFVAVFSSLLIAGLIMAVFVFNERYNLNLALEIGSIASDGAIKKLEAPESIVSKLSNVLVPKVTAEYRAQHVEIEPFSTQISVAKGSEIILIQNKVKDTQLDSFAAYQNMLARELIQDHDQKIAFYQTDLKAELASANDKLQQLQDPETLNSKLEKVILKQKGYESQLSHTQQSFKLLEQGGTDMILTSLSDDQRQLMMRNGEINQALLNVRYQDVLLSNRIQQDELKELLASSHLQIRDLKREHQVEIEKQQRVIEGIRAKLDSYNRTRVVSQPVPSLEPEGLTRNVLIMLVLCVALFTGFAAMLIAMFRDKVRQKREELA